MCLCRSFYFNSKWRWLNCTVWILSNIPNSCNLSQVYYNYYEKIFCNHLCYTWLMLCNINEVVIFPILLLLTKVMRSCEPTHVSGTARSTNNLRCLCDSCICQRKCFHFRFPQTAYSMENFGPHISVGQTLWSGTGRGGAIAFGSLETMNWEY